MLGFFIILVSNVVALPLIALEGVHWARDGVKFPCKVHGCTMIYIGKYNLVWHLRVWKNVTMESNKLGCPSIWEEALRHQNHVVMNAQVLSNPLIWFRRNELKAIIRVGRHANLQWDKLQVVLRDTHEVLKPTLVKLASNHIL
jgi:hypothetical protein